jgi:hypothetical protein
MAATRRSQKKRRSPSRTDESALVSIALLSAQVAEIIRELQTQLTRIAQIQAQLDRLARLEKPLSAFYDLDEPRTDN